MNRYPWWKYLIITVTLLVGTLYALPNLYGEVPAIQISPLRTAPMDAALQGRVEALLKEKKIPYGEVDRQLQRMFVQFADPDSQLKAMDVVRQALGSDYVVALHLSASTPGWLRTLNALPMYLGLDLRGGVYFLMEVDMDAAVRQAEERYTGDLRSLLRDQKIRYQSVEHTPQGVEIKFAGQDELRRGEELIHKEYRNLFLKEAETGGGVYLLASIGDQERREIRRLALQQNITTLRNRVNELGVAEPIITQQGDNRIVVQLPGIQDTARAKEILGATATLEFRMVDQEHDVQQAVAGRVPPGARLYYERNGRPVLLKNRVMLTGDYITDATSGVDQQSGGPAVFITLDGRGARIFSEVTKENVGKLMSVVFMETKTETKQVDGKPVKTHKKTEEVISVARILQPLGKRFQITGLESMNEAHNLALLLRAGALAAPMDIIEERTVGPSQGQDNIQQGFFASLIGSAMVLIFMVVRYKVFGMIANLALVFNVVLVVAIMSMLQATLTLPGIAGIALTVGMAVDANVLINERIREELRNGNSPQSSISAGYERAMATIIDSHLTNLISAVVLFGLGSGPVKGFAVTLTIGILSSLFTAIMVTRSVVNLLYGGRRLTRLPV
jgi:preprotein translocase subunit SecD